MDYSRLRELPDSAPKGSLIDLSRHTHATAATHALSRRRLLEYVAGGAAGALLAGRLRGTAGASVPGTPVPIPSGLPLISLVGGDPNDTTLFHVRAPGLEPIDTEPITITDFNGSVGLAYIDGMVTRTNTQTGEVLRLPMIGSDMRFMSGTFRGTDGRMHEGAFGFI
jgi:hypothetical protein